jgi:phospholipid/cholesterol/gamma-HCH transport system permease protein
MADDRWRLSTAYRIPIEGPAKLDVRRYAGRLFLLAATHMGRVSYLILEIFRAVPEWRIWLPRTWEQAYHVGVGSLFIVLLTAAFAGGVTSLQAGYQFTGTIPVYFAAGVITQSLILELGPVLTALILAGRVGARYAAELGTMRVTEQIDALESLGRSSVSHLIIPRVVAGTLMLPVLVVFADLIGILSGWGAARHTLDISNYDFIYGARYFFRPYDLWYSLFKAFFFGIAVTLVPCYMGFNTGKGAEGVGKATTAAVVSSSVMILALDAILSELLL